MFEITTESRFSSAHHLLDYKGPCENVHGHNWIVKAYAQCHKLNDIGLGIDFKDLRTALHNVIKSLDHCDLNTIFEPLHLNPSSENIAKYIFEKLSEIINTEHCSVSKIDVYETPGNCASYIKDA